MAKAVVFIPDGDFCADNHHLDCLYSTHSDGFHWCGLYQTSLGHLEDITVDGRPRRAFRKCADCKSAMLEDLGDGLVVDSEV